MATDLGKVGIVMKGTWSSSATYEVLDAVSYNNGIYIAKQAVPANTVPTNTTYWQVGLDASVVQNFAKVRHVYQYGQTLEIDISDYLTNTGSNYTTQILVYTVAGSGGVNNATYSLLALVNTFYLANGQTIDNSTYKIHDASNVTLSYDSNTKKITVSITTNANLGYIIL